MDMMMWGWSGMMPFMFLAWLLVIAALGVGVWWIVKSVRPTRRDDALDILRERYARGEIDADEYRQRLDVLQRK